MYSLLSIMPTYHYTPEIAIVNAARTSYLSETKDQDRDQKLLSYLYRHDHSSPFEMSELLIRTSLDESWMPIVMDPRLFIRTVPISDSKELFLRIDVNNALKVLAYYPDHDFSRYLKDAFQEHFPMLSKVLGFEGKGRIRYPETVSFEKVEVLGSSFWIYLEDCTANDEMVATISDICFFGEIKHTNKKDAIEYLFNAGDLRPLSLFSAKFLARMPVVTLWQLVRHRRASYSVQSGRYTKLDSDFYIPTSWRMQSKSNKQASEGVLNDNASEMLTRDMRNHCDMSSFYYDKALSLGVSREQARLYLTGWVAPYQAYVKMDYMDLIHFLRLRLDTNAQYEIRVYAEAMLSQLKDKMPLTFSIAEASGLLGV